MSKEVSMVDINCKQIESAGFSGGGIQGGLTILFRTGEKAVFKSVPHDLFKALQATDNPHEFYMSRIASKFKGEMFAPDGLEETVSVPPEEEQAQGDDEQPKTFAQAFAELKPEDDAHWTKGGLPDLNVLKEKMGRVVSRDEATKESGGVERDRWAEFYGEDKEGDEAQGNAE